MKSTGMIRAVDKMGRVVIPKEIRRQLKVENDVDSFEIYMDGDKVLILKQSTMNRSGEIGAIIYDGDMATLKKIEYVDGEDWVKLIPINPEYTPKTIRNEDLEQCHVLGIPRLLVREIEQ